MKKLKRSPQNRILRVARGGSEEPGCAQGRKTSLQTTRSSSNSNGFWRARVFEKNLARQNPLEFDEELVVWSEVFVPWAGTGPSDSVCLGGALDD